MKRVLTLREESMFNNGIFGLAWIILGFTQIFQSSIILRLVSIVFLSASIVLMIIPYFAKKESEDERAEYNKNRARKSIYMILYIVILICSIISCFKSEWVINLKIIVPFVLGGVNLLEFILFVAYEKVGA